MLFDYVRGTTTEGPPLSMRTSALDCGFAAEDFPDFEPLLARREIEHRTLRVSRASNANVGSSTLSGRTTEHGVLRTSG